MNKNDFDLEAIETYRQKALNSQKKLRINKEILENKAIEPLFMELKFFNRKDEVNRDGELFFCKTVPDEYSGANIRIHHSQGTEEITGCLFVQANKTFDFLESNGDLKVNEFKGLQKTQKEIFPEKALREIIMNAISHKEYEDPQIPIQIKVSPSELRVYNPGSLPNGWGIEKLYSEHHSHPRNQKILNAFYKCFYVDHKGDGFHNIIESCKEHSIFPPVFEPEEEGFTVRLLFNPAEWLKENGFETEHHLKIIEHVLKKEKIGNKEVQAITGLGETQSTKYLNSLAPILEKVGKKGPGVKYILKDDFYVVEK